MNSPTITTQPLKSRRLWAWLALALLALLAILMATPQLAAAYWLYWGNQAFADIFYEDIGLGRASSSVLGMAFSIGYAASLIHLAGRSSWRFLGGKLTAPQIAIWSACYIFAFAFPHLIHLVATPFDASCFNQRTGEANKWYTLEAGRIIVFDSPGYDRLGAKKLLVTREICEVFQKQRAGIRPNKVALDPRKIEFFNPATRAPQIWYARKGEDFSLFDASGFDPETSEPLLPITPSVVAEILGLANRKPAPRDSATSAIGSPGATDVAPKAPRDDKPVIREFAPAAPSFPRNQPGGNPTEAKLDTQLPATSQRLPEGSAIDDSNSFRFTVCNRTDVEASVAIMGREAAGGDWIVKGWMKVTPGACRRGGTFARGDFFMTAAGPGVRWGAGPVTICVPGGPFRIVRNGPRQCAPFERLATFTKTRVTNEQWTWNLN